MLNRNKHAFTGLLVPSCISILRLWELAALLQSSYRKLMIKQQCRLMLASAVVARLSSNYFAVLAVLCKQSKHRAVFYIAWSVS